MPVETYLVDTLVDRVSFHVTNSATPDTDLDREIRWALNEKMLDLVTRSGHWGLRTNGTISIVNGTSDYFLADDFHEMIDSSVLLTTSDKRSLVYIPETDYNDYRLQTRDATGTPSHYWISKRSPTTGQAVLHVWPTPTGSDTLAYRYRAIPAQICYSVRGSGEKLDPRFPFEHVPTLIHGAVTHFPNYINGQDLSFHAQMYQLGVEKMRSNANPVVGQTYQRKSYPGRGPWVNPSWFGNPLT